MIETKENQMGDGQPSKELEEFYKNSKSIVLSMDIGVELAGGLAYPQVQNGSLALTIPQILKVIEHSVTFIGKVNSDLQQIRRTNKDKENQKIVDELFKTYLGTRTTVNDEDPTLHSYIKAVCKNTYMSNKLPED